MKLANMKKSKVNKQAHVANTKYGMGDHYGTGIRNPVGTLRDSYVTYNMGKKKLGKPPKSLA